MIYNWLKFINLKLKMRFWYQIKIYYKDKNGRLIFDFTREIGIAYRPEILNHRSIKQTFPLHKQKIPKYLLSNGKMHFEVLSYIGWLNSPSRI